MSSPWAPSADHWRGRAVAITGASGFLGAHLTRLLVDLGADVVVLWHDDVAITAQHVGWQDRVAVVHGSVDDQATVERVIGEYHARTVFHLAAQTQVGVANDNPVSTFEANIAGTWAVLEACRRSPHVTEVVTASSDKAYGDQPVLPYTEAMPLLPSNPYDVSKACADLLAHTYHHTWGLPVVVTRCGNFFGPGDTNWDRLVPGTIRSLLRGERPVIRSDGTLRRDYLYIGDGALAYLRLAEALADAPELAGEAFNFSTERALTVLELVGLIQQALGTALEPDVRATASHEIADQHLSAEKARTVLGWAPSSSMEEALVITADWYHELLRLNDPSLVAVTGAGGYVGGRLVQRLGQSGRPLRTISRHRRGWLTSLQVELDLATAPVAEVAEALAGADVVVHLAGASEVASDQAGAKEATIAGTQRIADAAVAAGVRRIVHLSTVHVYGIRRVAGGVLTEEVRPEPEHPYAEARWASEQRLAEADLETVVLRLTNAVGAPAHPRVDRWTLLANDLCRQAVTSGALQLRSSGQQWRDFIPLADACEVIERATQLSFPAGTYNLGSGVPRTVRSVAELVADGAEALVGARPALLAPEPEGVAPTAHRVSIERLHATGWGPGSALEGAIAETLRFCLDHREHLDG